MRSGSLADRSSVAATIFRFAFRSPWRHRLLNLDPNPGNYLVLAPELAYPKGPPGVRLAQVGFVDFGCTFELEPEIVEADRQLFLAMIHRDGEELRYAAHRSGLIRKSQAQTFDSTNYRHWEELLSGPFLSTAPTELDPSWSRQLTDETWRLLETGRIALPPAAMLLWRQRLGVLSVLAGLRPRLPLRQLLADLLDDGTNPIPLGERYR
jgi:predicted unusual protein kinase regulating ubiquinone biosynthesis (AarF/ABC1/UbiB family)